VSFRYDRGLTLNVPRIPILSFQLLEFVVHNFKICVYYMATLKNILEGDDDNGTYNNKFYTIPQNQLDSTIAPIQIASALLESDMQTTTHLKPITHNSS
jgi:hypothetical protein